MTFFFITLIILAGFLFATSKNLKDAFKKFLTLSLVLYVNQITAPITVDGLIGIECIDFVLFVTFVLALFLSGKKELDRASILLALFLLFLTTLSIYINMINPNGEMVIPTGQSWDNYVFGLTRQSEATISIRSFLMVIRLSMFFIIALVTSSAMNQKEYWAIGKVLLTFSKIQIAFVALELILKNIFASTLTQDFILMFFGDIHILEYISIRGAFASLTGFTKEPTTLSTALFLYALISILIYMHQKMPRKEVAWTAFALLFMFLSGALASVVYFIILSALFFSMKITLRPKMKRKSIWVTVLPALLLLFLCAGFFLASSNTSIQYYLDRILEIMQNLPQIVEGNYAAISSYQSVPRMVSVLESLGYFLRHPLLGIGPQVVQPFSGVVAALADYGIVFFVLWLAFISRLGNLKVNKNTFILILIVVVGSNLFLTMDNMLYALYWVLIVPLIKLSNEFKPNKETDFAHSLRDDKF